MADKWITGNSGHEAIEWMRDHWWWRPGWREGRHLYACHIVFPDSPDLAALAAAYQDPLRSFPGLDLIPARWLHLTMQGIGFVDQLGEQNMTVVTDVVAKWLRTAEVARVTFDRPTVVGEAVYLLAHPAEPLRALRRVVRSAIEEALGTDRVPVSPEAAGSYRPHVSVAYSAADQPASPIAAALATVYPQPVTLLMDTVYLLEFHRDHRMYEWTSAVPISVGA